MSNDNLWRDARSSLRTSNAADPLRRYLQAEYEKRTEMLVSETSERNAGRAYELRKLLKDLYSDSVDTEE